MPKFFSTTLSVLFLYNTLFYSFDCYIFLYSAYYLSLSILNCYFGASISKVILLFYCVIIPSKTTKNFTRFCIFRKNVKNVSYDASFFTSDVLFFLNLLCQIEVILSIVYYYSKAYKTMGNEFKFDNQNSNKINITNLKLKLYFLYYLATINLLY